MHGVHGQVHMQPNAGPQSPMLTCMQLKDGNDELCFQSQVTIHEQRVCLGVSL